MALSLLIRNVILEEILLSNTAI